MTDCGLSCLGPSEARWIESSFYYQFWPCSVGSDLPYPKSSFCNLKECKVTGANQRDKTVRHACSRVQMRGPPLKDVKLLTVEGLRRAGARRLLMPAYYFHYTILDCWPEFGKFLHSWREVESDG